MRFRKFLSPSGDLGTLHGEDLLPKGLKRVRFSACLTTEYPFKPTKSNFATSPTHSQHTTPQALHGLYEAACRNREELMFPIFLTQAHQHTRYLTHLDFTNHPIDRKTAEPLADVLCLEFGLRHLILERCELEDETVKLLLHSLMVTNTLEELSLSFNPKLKTQGFKYIAIYIKGSQKLKKLDLSCTLPDKKAIGYIAQSLAKIEGSEAPSLETLLLQSCRLSLPHLKVLSAGVRASACLRHLSLMYNRITHQSAIWVGVMLRDYDDLRHPQQGLESLMLDGNEIKQGIQSITQALRRNQRLRSLSLSGCRIDADGCKWIGEALVRCIDVGLVANRE
ncbi:hypothetical protein BDF14DRAFT_1726040 [Spinellus fusiger]|nr:hypothetical protein BDF14DRAFT_1726040 [Spinellus fusiger]